MVKPSEFGLGLLLSRAFFQAQVIHGDLSLRIERFLNSVRSIIVKHCGSNASHSEATRFLNSLHTNDLYLSIACTEQSDLAWERFIALHKRFIYEVACSNCTTRDEARELTDKIVAELFLPGCAGASRIGSYEGRSPLDSWLRAIVKNQASDDRARKANQSEPLACADEMADERFLERLEARLRASRYKSVIRESFLAAVHKLSNGERLILFMRYRRELRSVEIARALGTSTPTLSRHLKSALQKLPQEFISALVTVHGLSQMAVDECVEEILENPEHSILAMIEQT